MGLRGPACRRPDTRAGIKPLSGPQWKALFRLEVGPVPLTGWRRTMVELERRGLAELCGTIERPFARITEKGAGLAREAREVAG